LHQKFIQIL